LVALVEALNETKQVRTTHTGVTCRTQTPSSLNSGVIVGPPSEGGVWPDLRPVQESSAFFVSSISQLKTPPTLGVVLRIGPIEVIWDPAGKKEVTYGMEFGISGEAENWVQARENWSTGVTFLEGYLRQISTDSPRDPYSLKV